MDIDKSKVFHAIKDRKDFPTITKGMDVTTQYFYIKAHKLVNVEDFLEYWQDGRDKTPLKVILEVLYHNPPHDLNYGHSLEEGIESLEEYVTIAKEIF